MKRRGGEKEGRGKKERRKTGEKEEEKKRERSGENYIPSRKKISYILRVVTYQVVTY